MPYPLYAEDTLDDLMRVVLSDLREHGQPISPSQGDALELTGTLLELRNPLARLSRSEARGLPFSCLGELCWYLAKSNEEHFITYYLPNYSKSADDGVVWGGYGRRLFDFRGINQIERIIDMLEHKTDSRQAVIQIFDCNDLVAAHSDVPCTCTIQFLSRQGKLNMLVSMRSNDAVIGLPHDIFCFTMLQEIVARSANLDMGTYKHMVGSLHVYNHDLGRLVRYLEEGWHPTTIYMPPMPLGDPWSAIGVMLDAEVAIRTCSQVDEKAVSSLHPYWRDLVGILRIFRAFKDRDVVEITRYMDRMSSPIYRTYTEGKARLIGSISDSVESSGKIPIIQAGSG